MEKDWIWAYKCSKGGKMLSSIIGKQLTDIYTVGFVYLFEEQREFTPDLRWIYLEFEQVL